VSAYQFQDQQHTEANIYNDLAQTPNPTPNDALAAANQDYAKIATTNPKSRYSKNFFIWEFLAFVAAALITAAILFVVEYHAAHTYQPVQATVVSVEPGYKGAVVFVFDYTFDGQAYSTQLVPDSPPAAQPGDTVTLLVNPAKPGSAIIAGQFPYTWSIFAAGIGVLFLVIALLYYFVIAPWADRVNQKYYAKQALRMQESMPRQANIPIDGGQYPNRQP